MFYATSLRSPAGRTAALALALALSAIPHPVAAEDPLDLDALDAEFLEEAADRLREASDAEDAVDAEVDSEGSESARGSREADVSDLLTAEEVDEAPALFRLRPPSRKLEVLPGAMARGTGEVEGRGVWIGSADRQFIFRYSGFVHLDMRERIRLDRPVDTELFAVPRRARFAFEGTTFGNLDYRFMFDPVAGDQYPLDAYIDWRAMPEFNLRVGKFKSPFGFERRARAFALVFNERGFPTLLAPNRDAGVFLHGQTVNGFFSYDVAVLGGAADHESIHSLRGTPEAAGRIYLQPFRLTDALPLLEHFGVGFSATWGREAGDPGVPGVRDADPRLGSMQSTGRTRFFEYRHESGEDVVTAFADGKRQRWSAHGHWRYGRFNALWEYVWSGQQISAGSESRFIANQAWQVYAGMALTDDEFGFFGIVPRRPFDPSRGQFGALAVAARYHAIHMDPAAFPLFADPENVARGAQAGSVSFQWILNQNLQGQMDAETIIYKGTAVPDEISLTARIQAFY